MAKEVKREIKFRMWSIKDKFMDDTPVVYKGSPCTIDTEGKVVWMPQEDTILMQFTGLHDKSGKEIYEGDIVRIKVPKDENDPLITHGIFPVTFSEGMFCLKMKEGEYALCEYLHQEAEVIGNIYENPFGDLLTNN